MEHRLFDKTLTDCAHTVISSLKKIEPPESTAVLFIGDFALQKYVPNGFADRIAVLVRSELTLNRIADTLTSRYPSVSQQENASVVCKHPSRRDVPVRFLAESVVPKPMAQSASLLRNLDHGDIPIAPRVDLIFTEMESLRDLHTANTWPQVFNGIIKLAELGCVPLVASLRWRDNYRGRAVKLRGQVIELCVFSGRKPEWWTAIMGIDLW